MNAQPTQNPYPHGKLEELISGHLENELTEMQREQLNLILKQDAIARDQFLSALRLDILLSEVLREQVERHELNKSSELSNSVQTNVWRTQQAHRNWRAAFTVAALLALAISLFLALRSPPQQVDLASVLSASSGSAIQRAGIATPLLTGMGLAAQDRITTTTSAITIRYPDSTQVILQMNSSARLELTTSGGKLLRLEQGELTADVAKQPVNQPMVLDTADAEATVLGTRLTFSTESGKSTLKVEEGRVRLQRMSDRKSVEVSTGHIAVIAANASEIEQRSIAQNFTPPSNTPQPKVLLITADRIPFYAHDVAIKATLEELGFTVTEKVFNEVTEEDAKDKALIVIPSHRCTSRHIFINTLAPVICWHPIWYEDLGMTEPAAPKMETLKPERLSFVSHPFLTGVPVPLEGATLTVYARVQPASSAEVIATIPGQPDQAVIFGYANESKLPGVNAHSRRLAFSIDVRNDKQSPAELPKQLFKAAVKWSIATKAGE